MLDKYGQPYYTSREGELLQDFDRAAKVIHKVLLSRFDAETADEIVRETRREYQVLIPQLPYIGGKDNRHTWNLITSAWFLAFYRVMQGYQVSIEQVAEMMYEMVAIWLKRYPRIVRRFIGWWNFTHFYLDKLKTEAAQSHERRYSGDWVYNFLLGDEVNYHHGIDFTECGICKFYHTQGADEFTPYLCAIDFQFAEAFGMHLTRTMTLAQGAPKCDFRFKRN
jgi:hypothetical protein